MPSYPFAGVQTLSGTTGVPAFGTTTTAAVVPTYDQFAGNVTGANPSVTVLPVTSAAGFLTGNYVVVSSTVGTTRPNTGRISAISGNNITVNGLTAPVANGAYILLDEAAESVTMQFVSGGGAIYVATAPTASSTDPSVIGVIYPGGYFSTPTTDRGHAYSTSQYWLAGSVSDSYCCSYTQG